NLDNLLTSTGTWVMGANGTLAAPLVQTNIIGTFKVANNVTATQLDYFTSGKLSLGANALITGSGGYFIEATQDDFLDVGAGADKDSGYIEFDLPSGQTLHQKAFSVTSNLTVGLGSNSLHQMTGNWSVGNFLVIGGGGATNE